MYQSPNPIPNNNVVNPIPSPMPAGPVPNTIPTPMSGTMPMPNNSMPQQQPGYPYPNGGNNGM